MYWPFGNIEICDWDVKSHYPFCIFKQAYNVWLWHIRIKTPCVRIKHKCILDLWARLSVNNSVLHANGFSKQWQNVKIFEWAIYFGYNNMMCTCSNYPVLRFKSEITLARSKVKVSEASSVWMCEVLLVYTCSCVSVFY